jgi:hypothetical protein
MVLISVIAPFYLLFGTFCGRTCGRNVVVLVPFKGYAFTNAFPIFDTINPMDMGYPPPTVTIPASTTTAVES